MFVFVSDLHLGDGGPLEDFALWPGRLPRRKTAASVDSAVDAMHRKWASFANWLAKAAARSREAVELILLGDALDLLQVEGEFRDPGKIHRVASAHRPWFQSLRRLQRAGVRIHWIVGNHDHELMDPAVWNAVREYNDTLNPGADGRPLPAWRDEQFGLHAEHGSQLDWTNAVADFSNPAELSLGSHVVLGLVNIFEPRCPLLDLMPDVPTALWYALGRAPGLLARPLRDFLFGRSIAEADSANLDFLPHVETLLHRVWMQDLPRRLRRRLREVLIMIAGALETPGEPSQESTPESQEKVAKRRAMPAARAAVPHPMTRIQRAAVSKKATDNRRIRLLQPATLPKPTGGNLSSKRHRAADAHDFQPACLVTGHTHDPGRTEEPRGVLCINTGSWKARARPQGRSRFRIVQPLDVVVIRPDATGSLDIRFLCAATDDEFAF